MSSKGFINNNKSDTTLEIANNQQPNRHQYNFSRCSDSSGVSDISNLSSKKLKIKKPVGYCQSKLNDWEDKSISAKNHFLFLDSDIKSVTSFSLLSS